MSSEDASLIDRLIDQLLEATRMINEVADGLRTFSHSGESGKVVRIEELPLKERVLLAICEGKGSFSKRDIARRVGVSRQNVYKLLDELVDEKKVFSTIRKGPHSGGWGRSAKGRPHLTPKGETEANRIRGFVLNC